MSKTDKDAAQKPLKPQGAVQFLTAQAASMGHKVSAPIDCGALKVFADAHIEKACDQKKLEINGAHPCGGAAVAQKVDLVILIDTSGSMSDEATQLSAAADAAITAAKAKCVNDLRVEFFGLAGTWSGTKFTTKLDAYLISKGVFVASIQHLVGGGDVTENGARGIDDVAKLFDWRAGAQRAMFYLSDEGLEGGDPQDSADVTEANKAIAAANTASMKVYTYAGTGVLPAVQAEYQRVSTSTGGQSFVNPIAGLGGFQAVLENVICAAGGTTGCAPVKLPELRPCFHIHWGDSALDHIETEDFEVLCIEAHNPYSNVVLTDVTLIIGVVTHKDGTPVEKLPDGTVAAYIKPDAQISFGDLRPCDPMLKDERSVSREVVLKTSGAKAGDYRLSIAVCFGVQVRQIIEEHFDFILIPS
jgi:hypothetical protein